MELEELNVEIRPHMGKLPHGDGFIEVDMQQSYVLLNGRQCGWIGNTPGAPLILLQQDLPKSIVDRIKAKIDEIRGVESTKAIIPPTTDQVKDMDRKIAEQNGEEYEEEDPDEDWDEEEEDDE